MALKTVGLDTAKHVFQVHGVDEGGGPFFGSDCDGVRFQISSRTLPSGSED
jgi:hypothetical protein